MFLQGSKNLQVVSSNPKILIQHRKAGIPEVFFLRFDCVILSKHLFRPSYAQRLNTANSLDKQSGTLTTRTLIRTRSTRELNLRMIASLISNGKRRQRFFSGSFVVLPPPGRVAPHDRNDKGHARRNQRTVRIGGNRAGIIAAGMRSSRPRIRRDVVVDQPV